MSFALKIAISAIVTAALIGGGVYYLMDREAKNERSKMQGEIIGLNTKVKDLEGRVESVQKSTSECPTVKSSSSDCPNLPVVVYSPATFTAAEKSNIGSKIIESYLYYMANIENTDLVSVSIEKYSEAERSAGYYFNVSYVTADGGWGGWLAGKDGVIDYWKPDCMGECPLTDEYKTKYPNNF